MEHNVIQKVSEILNPFLEKEGLSLYDIDLAGGTRKKILRIFIDRETGVTHDDCVRVSGHLSTLLDVEDIFSEEYLLEVSSPGLTRKLKKPEHFRKSIGMWAKVVFKNSFNGPSVAVGKLASKNDEIFTIESADGELEFRFEDVARARLEFEE
jgi:ribosome maturation factor RimP